MTTVARAMSAQLVTMSSGSSLAEAASVMSQKRVGSVLILDGDELAGILTERDIVRAISHDIGAPRDAIAHWMSAAPRTVSPDTSLEDARDLMDQNHIRHLPVTEGGRLVGMLSMRDLIKLGAAKARER
ncbi:MAG TPA: CBS domain-containing protein [Solirubrobacterales bacterium]|nr:CBS domain-containing protein [Solirubrobacterales bacterium]